jgi:multiubiquitin
MNTHENQPEHKHGEPGEVVEVIKEIIVIEDGKIVEEIIDIEEYAKRDKKPPHAKGYKIRIDKEYREVHVPIMTGREILGLVNKTPEKYLLSQKLRGGKIVKIQADDKVDFRHHGIERFQTLALDPTEG